MNLDEDEIKAIMDERKWWNDVLHPMGYHLIGWTGKHTASAGSNSGGRSINVSGAVAKYLHSVNPRPAVIAESYADELTVTKAHLLERLDELQALNLELLNNNMGLESAIVRIRDRNDWLEEQLTTVV